MNIQRFTAATSREALAKARMAFGEGTLILSNRPVENGVEVVATLDQDAGGSARGARPSPEPRSAEPSYKEVASQIANGVEEDADQLAMSTLSFQDYVRERMARRRQEEAAERPAPSKLIRIPPDAPATERPAEPHVILRVATLDDDPGTRPVVHIWRAHEVPWLADGPEVKSFAEWPPGR